MQVINHNGKLIPIASSIEELNDKQYLTAVEILCNFHEDDMNLIRIELLKVVLPFEDSFYNDWKFDCLLVDDEFGAQVFYDELEQLAKNVTEFFFQQSEDGKYTIGLGFTRNLYPEIRKGNKKFVGPIDGLMNTTISELGTLFTYYENYLETEDPEILHQIIAVMYRPYKPSTKHNLLSGYEGDMRLPLRKHESRIPARAKLFSTLNERVKDHIIFYFACSRNKIIEQFPAVFSSDSDSKKSSYGWAQTIWELAGNLTNVDKIDDQDAHATLSYISYLHSKDR